MGAMARVGATARVEAMAKVGVATRASRGEHEGVEG